ncbi:PKD domain-containing protein, partial [bacterium]
GQNDQIADETAQGSSVSNLNITPIADAGDDIITNVGALIHFNGSASSDPDGEDLTYLWNLGDGSFEKGASFDYTYFYSGEYLVTLEVFDGQWSNNDNIIVTVYPSEVYISELLPDPEGKDEEGEWIELWNNSHEVIDLSGWKLDDEDGGSSPFVFPEHSFMAPNSYLVLRRSVTKIALNNDNDQVRLLYPMGEIADEVSYEDVNAGYAAAKKGENFFWTELPTPGIQNLIFSENITKSLSQQNTKEIKEKLSESSHYLLGAEAEVALPKKRISLNLLINSFGHNVKLPTLADLDESFRIKEVFAQNDYLAQFAVNDLNDSIKKISLNKNKLISTTGLAKIIRLKPKIILFLTTAISSILFGIWIVALKGRFFS